MTLARCYYQVNRKSLLVAVYKDLKNNGLEKKSLTLRIKQNVWHVLGNGLIFFLEAHGSSNLLNENRVRVLRKCHGKFDSLVFEMLPSLNTQMDLYVPNFLFNSQY